MTLTFSWAVMQFQVPAFQRNLHALSTEQEAEDSCDMLVAMYQITWCHIPNTAMLMVTSVRTSNIIVDSVANNLMSPFLWYSTQENVKNMLTRSQAFYAHFITDSSVSKLGYSSALNTY